MRTSQVLFSALTKRTKKVRVQLLKDFPKLEFVKGEIVQVKASLMNNVLHGYNGAKYIIQDSDIDQDLLRSANSLKLEMKETLEKAKQMRIMDMENTMKKQKEIKFFQDELDKIGSTTAKNTTISAKETLPKTAIDKNLTLEDIKIPGLDL